MHLSVGDLFKGALAPSLILVILYILYILIYSRVDESVAPAIKTKESYKEVAVEAIRVIIPPLILILTVLGSILCRDCLSN